MTVVQANIHPAVMPYFESSWSESRMKEAGTPIRQVVVTLYTAKPENTIFCQYGINSFEFPKYTSVSASHCHMLGSKYKGPIYLKGQPHTMNYITGTNLSSLGPS